MSDIAGIEARLDAALDRIAGAAERIAPPDTAQAEAARAEAAEAEVARLSAALEAEKAAHGQMADRVDAIRAKQDETVAGLEARTRDLETRLSEANEQLGRLRRVNAGLRESARALRRAAASGELDATQLNQAMEAELEATRAAQAVDRGELDAILAELTPLIEEKADV